MIRLSRPSIPACIDGANQVDLINRFKATGDSVWNIQDLKNALSALSHNKCCYCESPLGTRGAAMEVEHFKHKSKYPDDVVRWENLLPSCRRCNAKKGIHDVVREPIVDPCTMIPKQHLMLERNSYKHRTDEGRATLEVFEFNTDVQFMVARYRLALEVRNKLVDLRQTSEEVDNLPAARRLRNRFRALLVQSLPKEAFAATLATEICSNQAEVAAITRCLETYQLWDQELDSYLRELSDIALL